MKKIFLLVAALMCVSAVSATKGGPASSVATVVGGPASTASVFDDQPDHLEFKYYGFYGIVDYAFMTNINKTNYEYTDDFVLNGVTAIAGFQWRKESAVGLGVSYLMDANGSFTQLPVFVELRSHYTRNRVTPYSSVQLGYAIPMGGVDSESEYTKINEGGITFGLEAGGRFAITRNIGVHLSVGYQFTQFNEVERGDALGQPATRLPEYYSNLKLSLGVNF